MIYNIYYYVWYSERYKYMMSIQACRHSAGSVSSGVFACIVLIPQTILSTSTDAYWITLSSYCTILPTFIHAYYIVLPSSIDTRV